MHPLVFWGCVVVAALIACATARAETTAMPVDEPVTMNGLDLACTGVGDDAREDPRWKAYGVRIEFANRDAQYLSDVEVKVEDDKGAVLFEVRCDSPWLLTKLTPGKYRVTGTFEGFTKSAPFTAPKSGQSRVVVTFQEVAGDQ